VPSSHLAGDAPDRQSLGERLAQVVLLVLAVLQASFFTVRGGPNGSRMLAIALAVAAVLARWLFRSRPVWSVSALTIVAAVAAVNLGVDIAGSSPPFAYRKLEVTVVLSYAATGLAGLAAFVWRGAFPGAMLMMTPIVAVLLVAENILEHGPGMLSRPGAVRWEGSTIPDSVLGERYAPYAVLKTYYPDNPRGYFDEPDPMQGRWNLEVHEGSVATVEFPPEAARTIRVGIAKAAGQHWHIQINEGGLRFRAGERYSLGFRARARAPRTMALVASQGHPPWENLGLYREVSIDTVWQDYADTIRAVKGDENARVGFNVGASSALVELSDIEVRRLPGNELMETVVPKEYSVTYRMNDMGCRGRDYPIPRDSATWRILSLGDSFTLGVGVHAPDVFSSQLEHLLSDADSAPRLRRSYEVINCGISGYSTREERLFYEQVGSRYAPDVVLLAVVDNDDISWLEEREKGYYQPVDKYQQLLFTWGALQGARDEARRPPPDFSRVRDEVRRLEAACREDGVRLVVVAFQTNAGSVWDELTAAIEDGVRGTGASVLRMGPLLANRFGGSLMVHSQYDTHPNEVAHRLVAEALRDLLRKEGLDGRGSRSPRSSARDSAPPQPVSPTRGL
jgi:lysophospholipase L1-like esterase